MSSIWERSDALFAEDLRSMDAAARPPVAADNARGNIVLSTPNLEPWQYSFDNGSKWSGGFGATEILLPDYWTLRQRSVQLFETNLYARGLIRRLVTNEINCGLHLESKPEEKILGLEEDSLSDWAEGVENRFGLWESRADLCDHTERYTFGALQAEARRASLISGDVLVVLRQDQRTKLPRVQLWDGQSIQTPINYRSSINGTLIRNGVELDEQGRHIAYHVRQSNGTSLRLPAWGEKSGRRLAWLLYGCDKKLEDTRGKPLLALILQSLKDIDRYRDATIIKAGLNAMLAMFVTKTQDKPGSIPLARGAIRAGSASVMDNTTRDRRYKTAEFIPGLVIDELQVGEEPKAFQNNGTDEKYGDFEASLLSLIAWGNEIPPEILTLSFNSNYSASQAAINEFKMVLNQTRTRFGESFCQPVYEEWLIAETLARRITAPGLLDAWRDASKFDTLGAWFSADWSGNIKPAVDQSKLVDGYGAMVEHGFITHTRAARELTGTKWSKNVQRLKIEAQELADAMKPLAELEALKKSKNVENEPSPSGKSSNPNSEPVNKEADLDGDSANAGKPRLTVLKGSLTE